MFGTCGYNLNPAIIELSFFHTNFYWTGYQYALYCIKSTFIEFNWLEKFAFQIKRRETNKGSQPGIVFFLYLLLRSLTKWRESWPKEGWQVGNLAVGGRLQTRDLQVETPRRWSPRLTVAEKKESAQLISFHKVRWSFPLLAKTRTEYYTCQNPPNQSSSWILTSDCWLIGRSSLPVKLRGSLWWMTYAHVI